MVLRTAGAWIVLVRTWHVLRSVDVRYAAHGGRLDFSEDTKLGATVSEDAAWRDRVASSAAASTSTGGGWEWGAAGAGVEEVTEVETGWVGGRLYRAQNLIHVCEIALHLPTAYVGP
jgi:hypothetical protein